MGWIEKTGFTLGWAEYVGLRLARRFLLPDPVLRLAGRWIPYYRTNANEVDPRPVVEHYASALARSGRRLPADPVVLEIGSGATNAVGYALAQHGLAGAHGSIALFEPFAPLDEAADREHRRRLPAGLADRVRRTKTLDSIPAGSVDLVLSNSVLEHIAEPVPTFAALRRVLAPSGLMLHAIDYRDHFFKYPYHFLLFSDDAWRRWLDPGDLPRWRLGDHLRQLESAGFRVEVIESHSFDEAFERIAPRIHPRFDRSEPGLRVTLATLFATPAG